MGQPARPDQLAGDQPGVHGHLGAGRRLLDEFRVAERDGDRGTRLMGGVLQELALLLRRAQVSSGDPLPSSIAVSRSWWAASRLRPCQTITRNISAISGTCAR